MADINIDFEGTSTQGQNSTSPTVPTNQDDLTHLHGGNADDISSGNNNNSSDDDTSHNTDDQHSSTGGLVVGDQVEVDGTTYTVADNGNLVDDKGNVFKEAKDVAEWLKSVNVQDENEDAGISIDSIKDALGVSITDENGNEIEFTNDANGIKSYVDSVINLRSNELQAAAINRLYVDNPLLKQFQDYVQLTGSARGFGEIPDRSGIRLDKDNEMQLKAVIRMAAEEFGDRSLNENYLNYLRDAGALYDEAQNQLNALIEKDEQYRKDIETRAALQRQEEEERLTNYWEQVDRMINGRVINGYKIPDSFTKEVDGKKIVITPNDFFKYLSDARVQTEDGNYITAYQRDLANLTDEQYMAREMLDAWLMFTGGTYKDLIDMAVKEDSVRKLVIKSKQNRSNKSVNVVKKQTGKTSIDDIIF